LQQGSLPQLSPGDALAGVVVSVRDGLSNPDCKDSVQALLMQMPQHLPGSPQSVDAAAAALNPKGSPSCR
jgi:hypothetical protein